jgi:hypothetical protein
MEEFDAEQARLGIPPGRSCMTVWDIHGMIFH